MSSDMLVVVLVGTLVSLFVSLAVLWQLLLSDRIGFCSFLTACMYYAVRENAKAKEVIRINVRPIS